MTNSNFLFSIIISALICHAGCKGQGLSREDNNTFGNISAGSIVSEMEKDIMIVFQDTKGNYWFGSRSHGAYLFNGKELIQYTTDDGLTDNRILGFQEDVRGHIFIQTIDGIHKLKEGKIRKIIPEAAGSLNNEWTLHSDDLWFSGGWDANFVFRYDGTHLYRLEFPEHPLAKEHNLETTNSNFSPYGVYTTFKDSEGAIWFGTSNLGACRYDGTTFTWIVEDGITELDDGPAMGVRSIIEDKEGYFWFCNDMTSRFKMTNTTPSKSANLDSYDVLPGLDIKESDEISPYFMSIIEDELGNLWLLTYDKGVWRFDGHQLEHIAVQEDGQNIELFMIYKDRLNNLWLGSHNHGPWKFDGKRFQPFTP